MKYSLELKKKLPGKKTRPLLTIISFALITICNLFPPAGKILFNLGPLIIAEGSLQRGLQRAVTMEGLIMFSKLMSIPRLPGKLGNLLYESFGILEQMNGIFFGSKEKTSGNKTEKRIYKPKELLKKLDSLLCEISGYR